MSERITLTNLNAVISRMCRAMDIPEGPIWSRDEHGNNRARDVADMVETGTATLYLVKDKAGQYEITNWHGSLRLHVYHVRTSPYGGGFGSQRTDAWFTGPDGKAWHAVNRGDNQVARCRRLKGS